MSSQVSNNVHIRNVFIGYNSVSDIDSNHPAIASERKRMSGTQLNHLSVPVKTKETSSANVNPIVLKKSLEDFDISGFSRPSLAVLIALMEASSSDLLAQAEMQVSFTHLARAMTEAVSKDIVAQGNSSLIQGVVSSAAGTICGSISGYKQCKGSSLSLQALSATEAEKVTLNAAAQKAAGVGLGFKMVGEGTNSLSGGISKKAELGYSALQKTQEQDTQVSNTLTETSNQEKEKVKEYKEQILRIIQGILDDQKQATDAAAMKC